jgi:hypothetical protein
MFGKPVYSRGIWRESTKDYLFLKKRNPEEEQVLYGAIS